VEGTPDGMATVVNRPTARPSSQEAGPQNKKPRLPGPDKRGRSKEMTLAEVVTSLTA
jgi:hypothetical protein